MIERELIMIIEKKYRSTTGFFDTYYIYDVENEKYIGLLEDHCRGVQERYFIGWYFPNGYIPGRGNIGRTEFFETEKKLSNTLSRGNFNKNYKSWGCYYAKHLYFQN